MKRMFAGARAALAFALFVPACEGPHDFDCADLGAVEGEVRPWCVCPPGTVQVEYRCIDAGIDADASAASENDAGADAAVRDGGAPAQGGGGMDASVDVAARIETE